MKQNSSIMFHGRIKHLADSDLRRLWLFFAVACSFLAAHAPTNGTASEKPPEYLASFDPAKGFKPAQTDLTEIFLQIAGSLECHGSPVPYLRHMQAEHMRIETQYSQRFGRQSKADWPAYMTDDYFAQFAGNWDALSPRLGLATLAKDTGHHMRDAILGTRGNGTILVDIFNRHQANVFNALAGKRQEPAGFDALKKELVARLYLDQPVIHDEHFSMAERDAVDFASGIHGPVIALFKKLDAKLGAADAAEIKAAVVSAFVDVGRAAQAELELGIVETALNRQPTSKQASAH